MKTPLVETYDKYNIKGARKDTTCFWITCITSIFIVFMFILSVLWLVGQVKADVNVGGYVESSCSNTPCTTIQWNNRLILIPLF